MSEQIQPFHIKIPQADVDDLRARLDTTRWAAPAGEEYGLPDSRLRRLVTYWRDGYDWRATEARLNSYPQFITKRRRLDDLARDRAKVLLHAAGDQRVGPRRSAPARRRPTTRSPRPSSRRHHR